MTELALSLVGFDVDHAKSRRAVRVARVLGAIRESRGDCCVRCGACGSRGPVRCKPPCAADSRDSSSDGLLGIDEDRECRLPRNGSDLAR